MIRRNNLSLHQKNLPKDENGQYDLFQEQIDRRRKRGAEEIVKIVS